MSEPGNNSANNSGRDSGKVTPLRPKRPCPECSKPSSRADYPFCSPRCKNIDLNRWLSGSYAIPATEDDEDAGDGGEPA